MTVTFVNKGMARNVIFGALVGLFVVWRASAEIIPSNRRIDWAGYAGVPGGIPNRTTIYATLNPGATAAQINSAIANCPNNQVVFLNAGTYNVGQITLSRNGVTLRGAGMGRTILNSSATSACVYSPQYGFGSGVSITSGYSKGSTNIVLASSGGFAAGNLVRLDQNDDTSFVFSAQGPGRNVAFTARITGVSGNAITFWPPLPWGFSSALAPRAAYQNGGPGLSWSGLEDMTINNNGGAADIFYLWGAYACWAKNVEMTKGQNSFNFFVQSLQCEVRHSYMHHAINAPLNTDGFGVYLYDGTSYCLLEDNIFSTLFVAMWQTRSSANAILYNFCTNGVAQGFTHQLGIMNAGHGAHPMMTLWEGNIGEQWQHDAYHGSASHQVVFRNWIHGLSTYNDNRKMIDIGRGSYYFSVVGNVLGNGSWTPNQFEMSGQPGYNVGNVIYRFGYPNMANNGYDAGDIGSPWPYAITYPDAMSKATVLRHGNYDYYNRALSWDPSISDRTIPASLYYTSKPAYFGNLPWPPFDPASPNSASMTNIPAGYRFVFGVDPPTGPVNNAPTAIANASPRLGSAPLAVSFSSAGSSDPEGTALTYNWTFGDGTPNSTAANPSHSYTSNGSYFARLTVSDGTNQVTSADINIRVGNQPPVIAANATPRSGPAPLAVAFSSSGSSDPEGTTLTYSWDFGDVSSVSTAANPGHTYQANGVYTARLTVSDGTTPVSSNLVITVNNGLVAAYDFDAGSGATLTDASGSGNTGTISGATWATAGKYGKALSFNGASAVVNVPSSAALELTTGVTLEAWVYPTSFNADYQSIVTKPIDSSFNGVSYVLQGASRPTSVPSFATSVSAGNLLGPSTLPLNTWSHLAGTYDGITARLYINGVQVSSQAQSGSIATSPEALRIGLSWAGMIDELRIYNRALSASDVQRDMNTSVSGAAKPSAPSGFRVVGP